MTNAARAVSSTRRYAGKATTAPGLFRRCLRKQCNGRNRRGSGLEGERGLLASGGTKTVKVGLALLDLPYGAGERHRADDLARDEAAWAAG